MNFRNKTIKLISILMVVVLLFTPNTTYAKTYPTKTIDWMENVNIGSGDLKKGGTDTYTIKMQGNDIVYIRFQSEDDKAYDLSIKNKKGKSVLSKKKSGKLWGTSIYLTKGTYTVKVKALKNSIYSVRFMNCWGSDDKGYSEYIMGYINKINGTVINTGISGGKWVAKDEYGDITKTLSTSKAYKITDKTPTGSICYVTKDKEFEYKVHNPGNDMLCEGIYDYDFFKYSDIHFNFNVNNSSNKTIKKIKFKVSDTEENYIDNVYRTTISENVIVFKKQEQAELIKLNNKVVKNLKKTIYIDSVEFVYSDNTTKKYDVKNTFLIGDIIIK